MIIIISIDKGNPLLLAFEATLIYFVGLFVILSKTVGVKDVITDGAMVGFIEGLLLGICVGTFEGSFEGCTEGF
jgi:hypothetical protein